VVVVVIVGVPLDAVSIVWTTRLSAS